MNRDPIEAIRRLIEDYRTAARALADAHAAHPGLSIDDPLHAEIHGVGHAFMADVGAWSVRDSIEDALGQLEAVVKAAKDVNQLSGQWPRAEDEVAAIRGIIAGALASFTSPTTHPYREGSAPG